MPGYQDANVNEVNLDSLDITVHKVLELGIICEAGMQNMQITGSEDFSDLFDSIGCLLRYCAAKMLWEVYKDDEQWRDQKDHFMRPTIVSEAKESIISLDSFSEGLVERLMKS